MTEYSRRTLLVGGAVGAAAAGVAVAASALGPRAVRATAEGGRRTRSASPTPTTAPTTPVPPPVQPVPPVALGAPVLAASPRPRTSGAVLQQLAIVATGEVFTTQSVPGSAPGLYTTVIARCAASPDPAAGNPEVDAMVVVDGGHGLGLHVEPRDGGGYDVWASLQGAVPQSAPDGGRLARFAYTPGVWSIEAIPGGAAWLPQFPNDLGEHQEAVYNFDGAAGYAIERMYDFRTGRQERYTRRRIDDLVNGVDRPEGRVMLPVNAPTLQGFATVDGSLFRWVGRANGGSGAPVADDPMTMEQFDWATGARVAATPFPTLGQDGVAWRGGAYEPEGCAVRRAPDGRVSLLVGVTVGGPGDHAWPVYELGLGSP